MSESSELSREPETGRRATQEDILAAELFWLGGITVSGCYEPTPRTSVDLDDTDRDVAYYLVVSETSDGRWEAHFEHPDTAGECT